MISRNTLSNNNLRIFFEMSLNLIFYQLTAFLVIRGFSYTPTSPLREITDQLRKKDFMVILNAVRVMTLFWGAR